IHTRRNFLYRSGLGRRAGNHQRIRHLRAARLEHLTEPVKNLPAIVRSALCPVGARLRRGLDSIAQILARALRNVREQPRFALPASRLPPPPSRPPLPASRPPHRKTAPPPRTDAPSPGGAPRCPGYRSEEPT